MKKFFICLSLTVYCLNYGADASCASTSGKIKLQMSLPLLNGDFIYTLYNTDKRAIEYNIRDVTGRTNQLNAVLLNQLLDSGTESFTVTPKGLVPTTRGLLAVLIQSLNRQDKVIFLLRTELNAPASARTLTIVGKVIDINIVRVTDEGLKIKYLIRKNKSLILKAQQYIPIPFKDSTPITVTDFFKKISAQNISQCDEDMTSTH